MDTLGLDLKRVSESVRLIGEKVHDVDHNVGDLRSRLSGVEKARAVKELEKMLQTIADIAGNVPEASLEKTDAIKESIASILADLGSVAPESKTGSPAIELGGISTPGTKTTKERVESAPVETAPETSPQTREGNPSDTQKDERTYKGAGDTGGDNQNFGDIELHQAGTLPPSGGGESKPLTKSSAPAK